MDVESQVAAAVCSEGQSFVASFEFAGSYLQRVAAARGG
jgi:hypothetical protein